MARRKAAEISVYDYLDHRAFLGDYYVAQKERGRGFSYRLFSRRAGLRSPNHLKLVIEGQRRLTPEMAVRYAAAMKLPEDESAYFLDLVAFNHARTPAERADTYQRLTGHRGYRKAQTLDQRHAAYYSQWYIPAIREMAMLPGFRGEPGWIAERMVPPITREQAASALETLVALSLLTRHEDGTLAPAEWVVKTEDATRGVHLASYHRVMLERAREALDHLPGTTRNLSAITLCTSAAGYERIVERVKRFRQELITLASLEDEGTHVVHVGVQIFPLTRPPEAA
ncbi:TIGR02147 family protein [Sandaracinus amylolyticus]|uniref:TIGR02147 family protein n=1 Tax=Sandaracinus amylolyticus TaxID=927083 RepID=UPI001F026F3A|nr:TIGR02147 family protein [Sandaracinus amylolyticus]UJR78839.1 Hypothetical protein I5071_8720 [Sandaracinus amylolyticus]